MTSSSRNIDYMSIDVNINSCTKSLNPVIVEIGQFKLLRAGNMDFWVTGTSGIFLDFDRCQHLILVPNHYIQSSLDFETYSSYIFVFVFYNFYNLVFDDVIISNPSQAYSFT
eukprot:GHVU01040169.1.p1 GENE.GHVU01040169.1~~GHVU01040169.1.p1  ORF type:complete len:112 (-),score=0.73 GHVU01040169.1:177-512(-)